MYKAVTPEDMERFYKLFSEGNKPALLAAIKEHIGKESENKGASLLAVAELYLDISNGYNQGYAAYLKQMIKWLDAIKEHKAAARHYNTLGIIRQMFYDRKLEKLYVQAHKVEAEKLDELERPGYKARALNSFRKDQKPSE